MIRSYDTFGVLQVTRYECAAGEGPPLHSHTEETAHITIVARGAATIEAGGKTVTHRSGAIVDLPAHEEHKITAIENGTVIVNIAKRPAQTE